MHERNEKMVKMKRTVATNMEIKTLYRLLLVSLALLLMLGCTPSSTSPPSSDTSSGLADRVEVVYFHRAHRCSGCLYAEDRIRYTVETYFGDELASGQVVLKVLNVGDNENAAIVEKYNAYRSSLFINMVTGGTDHIEEVEGIWLVLGDDEAFVEVVKGEIEKSLNEID